MIQKTVAFSLLMIVVWIGIGNLFLAYPHLNHPIINLGNILVNVSICLWGAGLTFSLWVASKL